MLQVRQPAVAGSFYHSDRLALKNNVDELLASARQQSNDDLAGDFTKSPKVIIVPHAGYIYSGFTAAAAYAKLAPVRHLIKRVILLGPVHRVPVNGLALPGVAAFSSPLGNIEIDQQAIAQIEHFPQIVVSPEAHEMEHSLEVQLPFLQTVLDDFRLLPLAVGDASAEQVAEVLETLWGGEETLIVISSDLSHFHHYQEAQRIDDETVRAVLSLQGPLNHQQACGGTPLNGVLLAAKHHNLQPRLLDKRNSGDTAGEKNRVVGYASFAFYDEKTND